jgi:rfaE bifunctional protein nucleotidyltransferase chain/domain
MLGLDRVKSKIVNRDTLAQLVLQWKQNGEKVVFTNGCFDILHLGHITYLFQAAEMGTKLVIGLNSDQSVRRLKGDSRPVQDEYARAIAISALECTDLVCIFDEDTPLELIKIVSPDFLIKGGDYSVKEIVGYQEVTASGGSVKTIPLIAGYATTKILKKIFEIS